MLMNSKNSTAASLRLAEYGESFMRMFEPEESLCKAHPRRLQDASATAETSAGRGGVAAAGASTSMRAPTEPGPDSRSGVSLPAAQHPPVKVRKHRPLNEVEEILQKARKGSRKEDGHAGQRQPTQAQPPMIDVQAERRAFMSHKAGKVHSAPISASLPRKAEPQPGDDFDTLLSPKEFKKLQLEVERLGGGAMDKKQRKKWHAQLMERLGAKAEKVPRCSANIGQGMARKRAQREARALQAAVADGTVRVKGMGKKRQADKDKQRDWGLQEVGATGSSFKGGVLKVKKPIAKEQPAGKGAKRSR